VRAAEGALANTPLADIDGLIAAQAAIVAAKELATAASAALETIVQEQKDRARRATEAERRAEQVRLEAERSARRDQLDVRLASEAKDVREQLQDPASTSTPAIPHRR
jgi:hypothetical protein